jgi:hypothetical protein
MPHFYFHIRDRAGLIRDEEGMDLTGEIAAREEAWTSAADLVASAARKPLEPVSDAVIQVEDEFGTTVYELPIKSTIA